MEQSILENSKGATYMSFILDIEIVIKKDGTRVNLAETKTKSQVSKKKGEDSKEPYASSRNQNVKVYAASEQHRKSIFELPTGNDEDSNLSESNKSPTAKMDNLGKIKDKTLSKSELKSDNTTLTKENIAENINFQDKTDVPSIVEKTSISLKENVKPKKKKITKAEKKAKVFKGKIEPIDFLECNRIFMCNYFKIPTSRNKSNFKLNKRSSDSNVVASGKNSSTVVGVEKTFSTQNLDKHIFKTPRLHRFWKKNPTYLVDKESVTNKYSAGDCDAISESYTDSNEFKISQLNETMCSKSITPERNNIMRKKRLISKLRVTESKFNSSLRRNTENLDSEDRQNDSTLSTHEEPDKHIKPSKKDKSMLKIKENSNFPKNVDFVQSNTIQYQNYKTNKLISFPFIKSIKNRKSSKTCTEVEGLLGLKINCFDQVDFVTAPQLNTDSGSTRIINCSGDVIHDFKEDNLPNKEKHMNENVKQSVEVCNETIKISNETHVINSATKKKGYNETLSSCKSIQSVLENGVSSNCINTAGNNKQYPFTKNDNLTDIFIDSKPNSCVISHQVNISSLELEENGYNNNFEKELKKNITDEKVSTTSPFLSSKHTLNIRVSKQSDVQMSQTKLERKTIGNTEKRGKEGTKSKTTTLKILHSYLKITIPKFKK